jgi:Tol biopolymer transport system component
MSNYVGSTAYDPGPSTLSQEDYSSGETSVASVSKVNLNAIQQYMTGQVLPQSPTPNPNGMAVMSSTGQAS